MPTPLDGPPSRSAKSGAGSATAAASSSKINDTAINRRCLSATTPKSSAIDPVLSLRKTTARPSNPHRTRSIVCRVCSPAVSSPEACPTPAARARRSRPVTAGVRQPFTTAEMAMLGIRSSSSQAQSRMREIRKSGSMSGEGKRSDAEWPKPPRPSSTLLEARSSNGSS